MKKYIIRNNDVIYDEVSYENIAPHGSLYETWVYIGTPVKVFDTELDAWNYHINQLSRHIFKMESDLANFYATKEYFEKRMKQCKDAESVSFQQKM